MEWRDQGVLLSVRKHGENSAIIEVFTAEHGRHAGVVRGASSRKMTPVLQPGAQLDVTWRARLEEHLGSYAVEPVQSRAAAVMGDRMALAGLNAVCGLLGFSLAEREPHPELYRTTIALLDLLGEASDWGNTYLAWEMALLRELGFGLDLTCCAVTGARDGLVYVSPQSGRAVSAKGAGEWASRLLPLPPCLLGEGPASPQDLCDSLRTTGYFLEHRMAVSMGNKPLPQARRRLLDALARQPGSAANTI